VCSRLTESGEKRLGLSFLLSASVSGGKKSVSIQQASGVSSVTFSITMVSACRQSDPQMV